MRSHRIDAPGMPSSDSARPRQAPRRRDIAGPDERYPYRYSGLRLLVMSGGKYFLVPDGWTRASGAVLVIPDTPDIRVEFFPGGS